MINDKKEVVLLDDDLIDASTQQQYSADYEVLLEDDSDDLYDSEDIKVKISYYDLK